MKEMPKLRDVVVFQLRNDAPLLMGAILSVELGPQGEIPHFKIGKVYYLKNLYDKEASLYSEYIAMVPESRILNVVGHVPTKWHYPDHYDFWEKKSGYSEGMFHYTLETMAKALRKATLNRIWGMDHLKKGETKDMRAKNIYETDPWASLRDKVLNYASEHINKVNKEGETKDMQAPLSEKELDYISADVASTSTYAKAILRMIKRQHTTIKNVIYHNPATIVYWIDGTKTVVKCGEGENYDPEKGLAMAIAKRALGDKGNYYETFKKWLPKEEKE